MQTTRLVIVAVGGQGNLLMSRILCEAALLGQTSVRMSEIHGMAQRGGVVESAIVFGDAESTIISDGHADVLVGFEPSETLRALNKCSANTTVITNICKLPPFTATIGKSIYPDVQTILSLLTRKTKRVIAFDATALALQSGNIMTLNMVLLGALICSGALALSSEHVQRAISQRVRKESLAVNLKAFEAGCEAAHGGCRMIA
jgi:indolepyruvate ferredoxin oxidoreductase beta subunit